MGTLERLDLSRNRFEDIPSDAIASLTVLTELDLSENHIKSLPSKVFQDINALEELSLSQNDLQVIASDAFEGLSETLQMLILSHTNFHQNQLSSLSTLRNLQTLDLGANRDHISAIPDGSFIGLNSLKTLNLHECRIKHLKPNSFLGLGTSLEHLDLVSNGIETIDVGAFHGLQQLQTLHLDDQDLSGSLSTRSFEGLENSLEYLTLQITNITTSNLNSITNLSRLRILMLGENKISSIPDGAFKKLENLEMVDLNANQISSLTQPALKGLQGSLKKIHLRNNDLVTLDECLFYRFWLLEEIWLGWNPLRCDCELRWLREWMDEAPGSRPCLYIQ